MLPSGEGRGEGAGGVSGAEARETAHLASTIAEHRRSEPRQLTKLFQGELDWIVMKSLEKDRTRRYATASTGGRRGMLLRDEPVQAYPPSAIYRAHKFARRHRGPMVVVTLVSIALLTGIAVSAWQAARATQAQHETVLERDAKELARHRSRGKRSKV